MSREYIDPSLQNILAEHGREAGWDIEDVYTCVGRFDSDTDKFDELYGMTERLKSIPEFQQEVQGLDDNEIYKRLGSETFGAGRADRVEWEEFSGDQEVNNVEAGAEDFSIEPEVFTEPHLDYEPEPEPDLNEEASKDGGPWGGKSPAAFREDARRDSIAEELDKNAEAVVERYQVNPEYAKEFAVVQETFAISRESYLDKYGEELGEIKADQFEQDWFAMRSETNDPDQANQWVEERLKSDGLDSEYPDVEKVLEGVEIHEEPDEKDEYREKMKEAADKKGEYTDYFRDSFSAYYNMKEKYYAYKAGESINGKEVTKMDVIIDGLRFANSNVFETLILNGLKHMFEKEQAEKDDVAKDEPAKANVEKPNGKDMGLRDMDGAFDNGYAKDVDPEIVQTIRHTDDPDYGRFFGADTTRDTDRRYSTDNMNVWSEGKPYTFTVSNGDDIENIRVPQMRMVELDHNFYQVSPFGRIEASKIMDPEAALEAGKRIGSLDVSNDKKLEHALEQYAEKQGVGIEAFKENLSERCKADFADRVEKGWERELERLDHKIEETKDDLDSMKDKLGRLEQKESALQEKIDVPQNRENADKIERIRTDLQGGIDKAEHRMDRLEKYHDFIGGLDKAAKENDLSPESRFANAVSAEEKAVGRAEAIDYTSKELDADLREALEIVPADPIDTDKNQPDQPERDKDAEPLTAEDKKDTVDTEIPKTAADDTEYAKEPKDHLERDHGDGAEIVLDTEKREDVADEGLNQLEEADGHNEGLSGKDAAELSDGTETADEEDDKKSEEGLPATPESRDKHDEELQDSLCEFLDGQAGFDDMQSVLDGVSMEDAIHNLEDVLYENYDEFMQDDDLLGNFSDFMNDLSEYYDVPLNDLADRLSDEFLEDSRFDNALVDQLMDHIEPVMGAEEQDPMVEIGDHSLSVTDEGLYDLERGDFVDSSHLYLDIDSILDDVEQNTLHDLDSMLPELNDTEIDRDDVEYPGQNVESPKEFDDPEDGVDYQPNPDFPHDSTDVRPDDFIPDDAAPELPDIGAEEADAVEEIAVLL